MLPARLPRCPGVYGTPKTAAAADKTHLLSERAGAPGKLPLLLFLALYGLCAAPPSGSQHMPSHQRSLTADRRAKLARRNSAGQKPHQNLLVVAPDVRRIPTSASPHM